MLALGLSVAGLFLAVVVGVTLLITLMPVPQPSEVAAAQATIVYWSDGVTEIGRLGDATRRSIPLAAVPVPVIEAVLAAEDRDFFNHGGLSVSGIGRALMNNASGGATQGGSTITQQYAKNAYLTSERTWWRKVQEAALAIKLETVVSKDEILEDYLNTIYFGRGAYGIEAAALAYFGISASELDLVQGAMLAAIIRSPSGLAPENDREGLQSRWRAVLTAMDEVGWIPAGGMEDLAFPQIRRRPAQDRLGGSTGFLLQAVADELRATGWEESVIEGGGLRIVSTFDRQAQRAAEEAVATSGPSSQTRGLRLGLAAVRPGTGEVLALYGGPDYVTDQIDAATRRFAQAGSTFKPFALAAALEQGIDMESIWDGSSPQTIEGYRVTNFADESYGPISLLAATEHSVNTAYVNLERDIGVDAVVDAARRAGLPQETPGAQPANLTFVLGTASPSAVDMATCYATFAAGGVRVTPTVLARVEGPDGAALLVHQAARVQEFTPEVARQVTDALAAVVTDGSGQAALALGRPAAGKTGTTDDNRSAWFVGYTPQVSAAVVMAREDAQGRPVSLAGTGGLDLVTGGSFPAQIWTTFAQGALEGQPTLDFPGEPSALPAPPTSAAPLPDPSRPSPSSESATSSSASSSGDSPSAPASTATPTATPTAEPSPTSTAPTDAPSPSSSADPTPEPSSSAAASPSAGDSSGEPSSEPSPSDESVPPPSSAASSGSDTSGSGTSGISGSVSDSARASPS